MQISLLLIVIGAIILILGIVFYFQGHGKIGPESSFMYSNPDWISYGSEIVSVGAMILGVGIILKVKRLDIRK